MTTNSAQKTAAGLRHQARGATVYGQWEWPKAFARSLCGEWPRDRHTIAPLKVKGGGEPYSKFDKDNARGAESGRTSPRSCVGGLALLGVWTLVGCGAPAFDDAGGRAAQAGDRSRGLILHYPLDADSGLQVADRSGAKHGQRVGAAWVPHAGKKKGALYFDGQDDRVDVPDIDGISSEVTFSMWIRPESLSHDDPRFISRATGVKDEEHWWMLSTSSRDRLRFRLKTRGETAVLKSAPLLQPRRWQHVAATYDGNAMRIFLDGAIVAEQVKRGAIDPGGGVPIAIGNQPAGAGVRPFHGILDDVRVYRRALSLDEIVALVSDSAASDNHTPRLQGDLPVVALDPPAPRAAAPDAAEKKIVDGPSAYDSTECKPGAAPIASVKTCESPCAVHFRADVSREAFHGRRFIWDFADSGPSWISGRKTPSAGEEYGPVAAHVFELAQGETDRTFNVRLVTASKKGFCTLSRVAIRVKAFDGKTVCVSRSGDFRGCPGRRLKSSATAAQIIASQLRSDARRILFHRGEQWSAGNTRIVHDRFQVGAYGEGAPPKLLSTGPFLQFGSSQKKQFANVVIADLAVEGGTLVRVTPFDTKFSRFLLLCTELTGQRNSLVLGGGAEDHELHDQVFLVNNVWRDNVGDYLIFGLYDRLTIVGNVFENAPAKFVRVVQGHDGLIAHNRFAFHRKNTFVTLRSRHGRRSTRFSIRDNRFVTSYVLDDRALANPHFISVAQHNRVEDPATLEDVLIEDNQFEATSPPPVGGAGAIVLAPANKNNGNRSNHVTIRRNSFLNVSYNIGRNANASNTIAYGNTCRRVTTCTGQ